MVGGAVVVPVHSAEPVVPKERLIINNHRGL